MATNAKLFVEIVGKTTDITGALGGVGKQIDGFADKLDKIGGKFTAAGGALTAGITAPILGATAAFTALGVEAVKASSDLEKRMSGIQSLLQADAATAEKLRQVILDLGMDPNLVVDAAGAADVIEMLVRNGLKAQDILDGAARSTVLFANATGANFSTAADTLTDALAVFDVPVDQLDKVAGFAAGAIINSKFDVEDIRLAIGQGGAAAKLIGFDPLEFFTAIAAIAPVTSSGSDAATSLKTLGLFIDPKSKDAAAAMKRLNLQFTDEQGNFKDLVDIQAMLHNRLFEEFTRTFQVGGVTKEMAKASKSAAGKVPKATTRLAELNDTLHLYQVQLDELRAKENVKPSQILAKENAISRVKNDIAQLSTDLQGYRGSIEAVANATTQWVTENDKLTEFERVSELGTIFGTDALRAAFGLSVLDPAEFQALMAAIEATDLQEMAEIRMDNLAGDVEILSGVWDTLKITIGDTIREHSGLRDIVQKLTEWLTKNADTIVAMFERAAPLIGRVGDGLLKILDAGIGLIDRFLSLDPGTQNLILGIIGAAAALGPLLVIIGSVISGVGSILGLFGLLASPAGLAVAGIVAALGFLGVKWAGGLDGMKDKFSEFTGAIGGNIGFDVSGGVGGGLTQGIIGGLTGLEQQAHDRLVGFSQVFATMGATLEEQKQQWLIASETMRKKWGEDWQHNTQAVDEFITSLSGSGVAAKDALVAFSQEFAAMGGTIEEQKQQWLIASEIMKRKWGEDWQSNTLAVDEFIVKLGGQTTMAETELLGLETQSTQTAITWAQNMGLISNSTATQLGGIGAKLHELGGIFLQIMGQNGTATMTFSQFVDSIVGFTNDIIQAIKLVGLEILNFKNLLTGQIGGAEFLANIGNIREQWGVILDPNRNRFPGTGSTSGNRPPPGIRAPGIDSSQFTSSGSFGGGRNVQVQNNNINAPLIGQVTVRNESDLQRTQETIRDEMRRSLGLVINQQNRYPVGF